YPLSVRTLYPKAPLFSSFPLLVWMLKQVKSLIFGSLKWKRQLTSNGKNRVAVEVDTPGTSVVCVHRLARTVPPASFGEIAEERPERRGIFQSTGPTAESSLLG